MATAVDDGIATIIGVDALGALPANAVTGMLVNRDYDDEVAVYGQSVQVQKRNALSAQLVTDPLTSDLTYTNPGDTNKTVTLNQHGIVPFQIDDFARAVNRPNILTGYAEDAAIALADQIDAYVITTLAENSSNTVTTGATDVTVANLISADATLDETRTPRRNRFAIWHPRAKEKLLAKGIFIGHEIGASSAQPALSLPSDTVRPALVDSVLGRRLGFDHYVDQNTPTYNSSANTQANVFAQRDACVLAMRPLPAPPNGAGAASAVVSEADFALRITWAWQPRRIAVEVLVDCLYGAKLFRPEFVVTHATALS